MSTPASPTPPTPRGDDRNPAPAGETPIGLGFEERMRLLWEKNGTAIIGVVVVILLAIAAKGGWEYFEAQREKDIGHAYAAAVTPAQLKAFMAAHPSHPLAGAAQLRLADEAYGDGRYADAIPAYEQAATVLKESPLASRARLGAAMAKVQGGRAAEGETALKAFAGDTKEVKAFRAEAAYHLATLAFAAGRADDVKTYADQLSQIDPTSPWAQRVLQLRAASPAPASAAASSSGSAEIKLTPGK